MLKRLGTLIGFSFFWFIAALALPVVFWIIGGLILGGTMLHMVLGKDGFGPGHRFFTIVSAVTLLLATASFFAGGDSQPHVDETVLAADVDDALDFDEDKEDTDAAEATEDAPGNDAEAAEDAGAEELPPVDVAAAIKAANAAKKGKPCKSLETVATAWAQLSRVPTDDKQFKKAKKAAAALEKCRKKAATALQKSAAKARTKARVALAKELHELLAAAGLKLKAKPQGKAKDKVMLKGNKKVTEEQIDEVFAGTDEGTILGRLQEAGFAKVSVVAGKVKRNYELEPAADDAEAVAQLEELGMNEPLGF